MPTRKSGVHGDHVGHALRVMDALRVNVPKARDAAGMTQEELGGEIGYSDGWISQVEHGDLVPRADILAALAAALSTSVGALLGEDASDAAALERALPGWDRLTRDQQRRIRDTVADLAGATAPAARAAEDAATYSTVPAPDLGGLTDAERDEVLARPRALQQFAADVIRGIRARAHPDEAMAGRPDQPPATPRTSRPRPA